VKRPLVVKLGSSLVVDERGRPRRAFLRRRAAELAGIVGEGTPVCVVSSGAIALGLAGARRPTSLPRLQAASALGQAALQRAWQDALRPHGVAAAQILLTSGEIGDRRAYVNVRAAFNALFQLGAVPVVNVGVSRRERLRTRAGSRTVRTSRDAVLPACRESGAARTCIRIQPNPSRFSRFAWTDPAHPLNSRCYCAS